MPHLLTLLIAGFATFRCALMFSSEEGPVGIFSLIRKKVPAKTNPGRGIRCFNCWSVWMGTLWSVFLYLIRDMDAVLIIPCGLALSGMAITINWIDK